MTTKYSPLQPVGKTVDGLFATYIDPDFDDSQDTPIPPQVTQAPVQAPVLPDGFLPRIKSLLGDLAGAQARKKTIDFLTIEATFETLKATVTSANNAIKEAKSRITEAVLELADVNGDLVIPSELASHINTRKATEKLSYDAGAMARMAKENGLLDLLTLDTKKFEAWWEGASDDEKAMMKAPLSIDGDLPSEVLGSDGVTYKVIERDSNNVFLMTIQAEGNAPLVGAYIPAYFYTLPKVVKTPVVVIKEASSIVTL